MATNPHSSSTIVPTPEQQEVIDRIAAQRARLRERRAARAQALAAQADGVGGLAALASEPLLARVVALTRLHPAALAAVAGLAVVAGPRRLLRWAGFVLPLLARMRR